MEKPYDSVVKGMTHEEYNSVVKDMTHEELEVVEDLCRFIAYGMVGICRDAPNHTEALEALRMVRQAYFNVGLPRRDKWQNGGTRVEKSPRWLTTIVDGFGGLTPSEILGDVNRISALLTSVETRITMIGNAENGAVIDVIDAVQVALCEVFDLGIYHGQG